MREGSPPPTCPVSGVSHISRVPCHVSHIKFITNCEACRWRVCYQRGIPRLVLMLDGSVFILTRQYALGLGKTPNNMIRIMWVMVIIMMRDAGNLVFITLSKPH